MDGSGAITFGSFRGLFLLTGFVTACSILAAFLMRHYKKQEESHHIQDADKGNEENGDCNDDIDNQATILVPDSSNTNSISDGVSTEPFTQTDSCQALSAHFMH